MPRGQVFISYSHKDKKWRDELDTQLKPYVRDGSIISWSDQQIAPGSQWFTEIESALANTKVAVLLITPYFLASDFIHEHELGPLLKQAEQGGVKVLWVPIRDSAYKQTALKNYQAALSPDTPLAAMTTAKRDRAWVDICEVIQSALIAPLKQSPKDDVPARRVPPEREMPFGAILIGAVLEDLDAAKVLRAALDQAGVIVWFDIDRLKAGNDVRRESRENVERCSFFVPIISANTKKREGYFRLEWHYASAMSPPAKVLAARISMSHLVPLLEFNHCALSGRVSTSSSGYGILAHRLRNYAVGIKCRGGSHRIKSRRLQDEIPEMAIQSRRRCVPVSGR